MGTKSPNRGSINGSLWASRLTAGALLLGALALGGCQTDRHAQPGSQGSSAVTEFASPQAALAALAGEWTLVELHGESVLDTLESAGLRPGRMPSITFAEEGVVSGTAGVNRYSSKVDLDELKSGVFDMPNAAMTKMAGPPELMKIEDEFVKVLTGKPTISLDADRLTLLSSGDNSGAALAAFQRTN